MSDETTTPTPEEVKATEHKTDGNHTEAPHTEEAPKAE